MYNSKFMQMGQSRNKITAAKIILSYSQVTYSTVYDREKNVYEALQDIYIYFNLIFFYFFKNNSLEDLRNTTNYISKTKLWIRY